MDLSFVSKSYNLSSPGLVTQPLNVPTGYMETNITFINSYLLKLDTWEIPLTLLDSPVYHICNTT